MKLYHKETGQEYNGDPVDCRELVQTGAWQKEPIAEGEAVAVSTATTEPAAAASAAKATTGKKTRRAAE